MADGKRWACRGRSGGLPTQLMFAAVHTAMHLTAAVVLMVLLELGVETCIKCAHLILHLSLETQP